MRKSGLMVLSLLFILLTSVLACTGQVSAAAPLANRTVYIEPSYQVYVDEISFQDPSASYNVTFNLISQSQIFSFNAYGPDNQTLTTKSYVQTSNTTTYLNYTVNVNTTGIQSFRLVTVLHGSNYQPNNITAVVSFFPILDQACTATTVIYLPYNSSLISYDFSYLSNYTAEGGRPAISGTVNLTPSNTTLGYVVFSGNFVIADVSLLTRSLQITPSEILVKDTVNVINTGSAQITQFVFKVPAQATNLKAMDTISYLDFSQNGSTFTVSPRITLYFSESAQISILYSLPLDLLKNDNGKVILSDNVLPDWLNMPVESASISIFMPLGSTDAQMIGGQIIPNWLSIGANSSYSLLTPYTNQIFSVSYVPSTWMPYIVQIVLVAIILLLAFVLIFLYIRNRRKKVTVASPAMEKKNPPK